jgi:hypothetical protein
MDNYTFQAIVALLVCPLPATLLFLELMIVAAGFMRDPEDRWELPWWTLGVAFKLALGIAGPLPEGFSFKAAVLSVMGLTFFNSIPIMAFIQPLVPSYRPIVIAYFVVVALWLIYVLHCILVTIPNRRAADFDDQLSRPVERRGRRPARHAARNARRTK